MPANNCFVLWGLSRLTVRVAQAMAADGAAVTVDPAARRVGCSAAFARRRRSRFGRRNCAGSERNAAGGRAADAACLLALVGKRSGQPSCRSCRAGDRAGCSRRAAGLRPAAGGSVGTGLECPPGLQCFGAGRAGVCGRRLRGRRAGNSAAGRRRSADLPADGSARFAADRASARPEIKARFGCAVLARSADGATLAGRRGGCRGRRRLPKANRY